MSADPWRSLPTSTQNALQRAGYASSGDLTGVSSDSLSKELGIPVEEAQHVLSAGSRPLRLPLSTPASSLLSNAAPFQVLPEVPFLAGSLIELCGPPGSGKSCLAMSSVCKVLEAGDEVLVCDMDGGLSATRLKSGLRAAQTRRSEEVDSSFTKSTHFTYVSSLPVLLAFLQNVPGFISKHPKIKLLVLDSLTVPFRYPPLSTSQRSQALASILSALQRLSSIPIVVILTTQVATKLVTPENTRSTSDDVTARAILEPALGDGWLSSRFIRVLLGREGLDGQRTAYITKNGTTLKRNFSLDDEGFLLGGENI